MSEQENYKKVYADRLSKIGTQPLKAVRLKCFECSAYNSIEAKKCYCRDCALWVLLDNRRKRKFNQASLSEVEENL